MKTRRQFLGTLFRSVAAAAAMCYAPSVLDGQQRFVRPKTAPVVYQPCTMVMEVDHGIPAGSLCFVTPDGKVYADPGNTFVGVSMGGRSIRTRGGTLGYQVDVSGTDHFVYDHAEATP